MKVLGAVPEWVAEADAQADLLFDAGAVARGRAYARAGKVHGILSHTQTGVLTATVGGSRATPYVVRVEAHPVTGASSGVGHRLITRCSCPVGEGCKHVVATLSVAAQAHGIAASAAGGPGVGASASGGPAEWERVLGEVTATPAPAKTPTERVGILLGWRSYRFTAANPRPLTPPEPGEDVTVTAVQWGAKGRWVKSGIDFERVRYRWGLDERQRRAMAAVGDAARAARGQSYSSGAYRLGEIGPVGVALLSEAQRAGVSVVAPDQSTPVRLVPHGLTAELDAVREEDGGVVLTPWWSFAGRRFDIDDTVMIGERLTAVARLDAEGLLLAGAHEVEHRLLPLIDAGRIVVPVADADRFLATYYPRLSGVVEVTSSDGSVEPPAPPPLSVVLTLRAEAGHGLHLAWTFRYGDGDGAIDVPWDAGTGAQVEAEAVLRRPADEAALGARVTAVVRELLPRLVHPYGANGPQLYPSSGVVGMEAVVVATTLAEELRAIEGVLVEIDGELPDYREASGPPVVSVGVSGSGETDWFDLDITIEVDGEPVPLRPVFTALALGEDHVLLDSGTWFPLDRPVFDRLRALIEEARALGDPTGPLRISRWQAGLWDDLADLGDVTEQSEAWREAVGGLLDPASLDPPPVPSALQATLRPYQADGYRWLNYLWQNGLGGILADDMGLGKTVQALAAILRRREVVPGDGPVLVVAPTSVIGTWVEEAAKFAPGLRVVAVRETLARRGETLPEIRSRADVVVTSYALVRLDAEAYREEAWSAVFLDEAQFVKNPRARTHAVIRALPTGTTIVMTGTPLENSLMDLWALLALAAPGLFPSAEVFSRTFRGPIEVERDVDALHRLQRRTRPLMLRRTKQLVASDLPPKQEQVTRVELPPAHRRLYDRRLARERTRVLGMLDDYDKNRIAIFRSLTLLRQLALAPSLVEDDAAAARISPAKVDAVAEHLAELAAEGHRALVFSQFTGFLRLVRERLDRDGIDYVYLDGRTRDRAARVAAWREGDAPAFLISLKAGGFGLTLTEADYVFVLDPWWNPAAEAQAVDRTHRIGQRRTVMVYRFIAENTIEEKVLALQERKRDLFTRVVDSGGAIDSVLTADDIRGLLAE